MAVGVKVSPWKINKFVAVCMISYELVPHNMYNV